MNDKGAELNKRVWMLFERAGFETKPNSNAPAEETITLPGSKKTRTLDLSASIKKFGVKIIGSNKARKSINGSLSVLIHDLSKLKNITKANGALFVLTEMEVSDEERDYAKQDGISVWCEEDLRYYEALVNAIGEYAKFEIINSLGIKTIEEKNTHYVIALRFNQPFSDSSADLFLFTITPEILLKTCVIYRKAQRSGEAYQRMLSKKRLLSVKKFVTQDNALLPPNIIIHFSDKVTWTPVEIPDKDADNVPFTLARKKDYELVVLRIPMEYASLELIDGQHRLYGFVGTEQATRESFNLVVLGMAKLPLEKRRDTFVAINDKSRRMDPNLVAYLKYIDDEKECQKDNELMAIKIVVELNKIEPFKNKIKLLDIGSQKITLKGFSAYDLKGLLGSGGLLRKYYPTNESKEYISALRLYFNVLKSLFDEQWQHPEKYVIFTNRGISAFLKLLRSILKACQSPINEDKTKKYLQALKDNWADSWETKKLSSSYVGSGGWKDLHRQLVRAIQKKYSDFQE
jgi:DGQHR domain-containing protein